MGGGALPPTPVKVGLVGMHIAHKSVSSKQWIWSTFEQVDNLDVDTVAHPNLKPSFFDPNCAIRVPNQQSAKAGVNSWATAPKTQIVRSIPIPADKLALNLPGGSRARRQTLRHQSFVTQVHGLLNGRAVGALVANPITRGGRHGETSQRKTRHARRRSFGLARGSRSSSACGALATQAAVSAPQGVRSRNEGKHT